MAPERIAAVGAGRMGRGIAIAFAFAGHPVDLIDSKPRDAVGFDALHAAALDEIRATLSMLAGFGMCAPGAVSDMVARVTCHALDAAPDALARADVVFEGVPETLDAKAAAFDLISRACRADAIVASTTSTILSDDLQGYVTPPGRFLNAHWLNPAFLVPQIGRAHV